MKSICLALFAALLIGTVTLSVAWARDSEADNGYEQAVAAATFEYLEALTEAKKSAAAAGDTQAVRAIGAKVQAVTAKPKVIGEWGWYKGVTTVKADGTCHWKGAEREEHGVWQKADGYLFNWGEHNNDWNYLNVDADGFLSGKFVKWGGELKSETKNKSE